MFVTALCFVILFRGLLRGRMLFFESLQDLSEIPNLARLSFTGFAFYRFEYVIFDFIDQCRGRR